MKPNEANWICPQCGSCQTNRYSLSWEQSTTYRPHLPNSNIYKPVHPERMVTYLWIECRFCGTMHEYKKHPKP